MLENKNVSDERKKRAEENAVFYKPLYDQVAADNEALKKLEKDFSQMRGRMEKLFNYYYGEWIDDREIVDHNDTRFLDLFSEDLLYEEIQERYKKLEKQISLMKKWYDR